jgi:hypothetical protein
MPKTKKENKMEINSKGKELDEIVNAIIIKCNDTIVEFKKDKDSRCKDSYIEEWDIKIDNIPVKFSLNCRVHRFTPTNTSPEYNDYKLLINTVLDWGGSIYLEEEISTFNNFSRQVKVEKDVIDRNDITRHIIDLFNFNDLKYCKIQNIFVKKDNIFMKVVNYFDLKCLDCDECCICYDKTSFKTEMCKHYICLECVAKMKTIKPPHDMNYVNCPMCKAEVREMINHSDNCDAD